MTIRCPYCQSETDSLDSRRCGNHTCRALLDFPISAGLRVGTILAEKYRIEFPIGRGGFGITYRARHLALNRIVAIKEFCPRDLVDREAHNGALQVSPWLKETFHKAIQRFEDEGRTLARLHHPHIVHVLDVFHSNNTAYLVMEYLTGVTLRDTLIAHPGAQPMSQIVAIMEALVSALNAAHLQHIFHLDIKPDNIVIQEDGRVVLIDFGAAKQAATLDGHQTTTTLACTPKYAPLELLTGKEIGPQTDLFELAMVFHELLTGTLPPDAITRASGQPTTWTLEALPFSYQGALREALDLERTKRPHSIKQWWDDAQRPPMKAAPSRTDGGNRPVLTTTKIPLLWGGIALLVSIVTSAVFLNLRHVAVDNGSSHVVNSRMAVPIPGAFRIPPPLPATGRVPSEDQETTLMGIRLGSNSQTVLARFGNPTIIEVGRELIDHEAKPDRSVLERTTYSKNQTGDSSQGVTWCYIRKFLRDKTAATVFYYYYIGPNDTVEKIRVEGLASQVTTKRGIQLGSTYKDVLAKYGLPERHFETADSLITDYRNTHNILFQFAVVQHNPDQTIDGRKFKSVSSSNKVAMITIGKN